MAATLALIAGSPFWVSKGKNMLSMVGPFNSGVAVGSNGAATANLTNSTVIRNFIEAVYIRYNDTPPAGTTDAIVTTGGAASGSPPAQTILNIQNAATDGWFYPRAQFHSTAGAAISAQYTRVPVQDTINVKIDGANAGDSVDIWLLLNDQ